MTHMNLFAVAMVMLGSACASAPRGADATAVIEGSAAAWQPQIQSAASERGGGLALTFSLPRPEYVSVLRVATQASVAVLGAPQPTTELGLSQFDAGSHRLELGTAPLYLAANAARTGAVRNRADGALVATDSPFPVREYALVVTTSAPMSNTDLQASLERLDLRGPDQQVLARVARAIGTKSGGVWGASASRTSTVLAPF